MSRCAWRWRAAVALTVAAGGASAQEAPEAACPDAAPLYAARDAPLRAWTSLLRLRRPRVTAREREDSQITRAWDVRLARVWPRGRSWCAYGAVEATLREEGMGYRNGPIALETVRALVEAAPRGRLRVTRRGLPEGDWRFVADPAVPDLDADGVPESLDERWRAPDAADLCAEEGAGECNTCGLPSGRSVVIRGSRGTDLGAAFFSEGRACVEADEPRYRTLLEALPRGENGEVRMCPAYQPLWSLESRRSPMMVRNEGGVAVVEWAFLSRRCVGWELDPRRGHQLPCDAGTPRARTIRFEREGPVVTERDEAPDLTVRCGGDAPCSLTAVAWRLLDGAREPHVIPVTISAAERARALGAPSADGRSLQLPAGYYAVEVRGARGVRVWQVTLDPSRAEPVALDP